LAGQIDRAKAEGRPYVEGGVYGGPKGMDFNTNTGEWIPSNTVGTINGRPATQVIAEGALKRGVSPEDTRSREVYNALLSQRSQANATPRMDIPLVPPPELPGLPLDQLVAPANQPKPIDVSVGFPGQPQVPVANVAYTGGTSNEAADRAQAAAMRQPVAPNIQSEEARRAEEERQRKLREALALQTQNQQ
jgi:hypothetical protein